MRVDTSAEPLRFEARMTLAALPYPQIDPVLLHLGPLELRWYALAYLAGLVLAGWGIIRALRDKALWNAPPFNGKPPASEDDISDMAVWALLGVIAGGRLGYDLFYSTLLCGVRPAPFCDGLPADFLTHPQRILAEWHGWVPELRGMSFHGGLLGVVVAVWLFCRAHKLRFLAIADLACAFAPIGLFFGRIANFINGELWGKPSTVPWAMVFPRADALPRHPSQLYEAALEGLLLFALLQLGLRVLNLNRRPGLLAGLFFLGYGFFRFIVEFYREPDTPLFGWFSMGMALSIPVWLGALALFIAALRRPDST
jgi:phosphatidylglycerol:prolipoprotein diacylglycerol transferase